MAKKQSATNSARTKKAAGKAASARPKKKASSKGARKTAGAGRAAAKRKTAAKTIKKKVPKKQAASAVLGRARIAGTAELDRYFAKDYEAREVFHFLGVKTLKELEQYSPDEIVELLTQPVVRTVDRIRKALALQNRCLAGDQRFAMEFKKLMEQR